MTKKNSTKIVLLLAMILPALSSCGFLDLLNGHSGGNQDDSESLETTQITLYDGDFSKTFDVAIGKKASISELTKQGYYSLGYFDSPEGGTKYFNADGTSTVAWNYNLPTSFYVQYAPISSFSYIDDSAFDGTYDFGWHIKHDLVISPECMNGIKANLDLNLSITASFSGYDSSSFVDSWILYYKNVSSYDEGNYSTAGILKAFVGEEFSVGTSYASYTITKKVATDYVFSGTSLTCLFSRGNTFGSGYLRNLKYSISFSD